MDLALFDFDGTITSRPTYTGFLRAAASPARKAAASIVLAPLIAGFRLGMVDQPALRQRLALAAFRGQDAERVRAAGERYARDILPWLIRPVAHERLAWHHARGDRVVVVSASLDAYLAPWCRAWNFDLICTILEEQDGRLTGRYAGGDCTGAEKARRVLERYRLADYGCVHAYGDTDEDRDLLALAHRKYMRWVEVDSPPAPVPATAVADAPI